MSLAPPHHAQALPSLQPRHVPSLSQPQIRIPTQLMIPVLHHHADGRPQELLPPPADEPAPPANPPPVRADVTDDDEDDQWKTSSRLRPAGLRHDDASLKDGAAAAAAPAAPLRERQRLQPPMSSSSSSCGDDDADVVLDSARSPQSAASHVPQEQQREERDDQQVEVSSTEPTTTTTTTMITAAQASLNGSRPEAAPVSSSSTTTFVVPSDLRDGYALPESLQLKKPSTFVWCRACNLAMGPSVAVQRAHVKLEEHRTACIAAAHRSGDDDADPPVPPYRMQVGPKKFIAIPSFISPRSAVSAEEKASVAGGGANGAEMQSKKFFEAFDLVNHHCQFCNVAVPVADFKVHSSRDSHRKAEAAAALR
jgi:hypothetical protein